MKTFTVTLFIILSVSAFAQKKQYLDEYKNKVSGPQDAKYYRLVESQGALYLVGDFYISNDQPSVVATAAEVSPEVKYEGKYKSFYENGQVEYEGQYKNNECDGTWKAYHENGRQADERIYKGDTTFYKQCWDESGKALLNNGTGIFKRKSSKTDQLFYYEVLNSLLIATYFIDEIKRDTIYTKAEKPAEYKGGLEGLYNGIASELVYPKKARRMGIQGVVYVSFLIDEEGRARDVKCLKGIGAGCDEEAIKAVSTLNNWIPGSVKGKPVTQQMVQPISFKLR